jgi:hypothetical protein
MTRLSEEYSAAEGGKRLFTQPLAFGQQKGHLVGDTLDNYKQTKNIRNYRGITAH